MSNKKIGFYFEDVLPDINIPLSDDFSFYYIKNIVNNSGVSVNIPELFLYTKTSNEFIKLSEPKGYYLHNINGKNSVNNQINLGLDDILTHNNTTNNSMIINGSRLFTESNNTYFSNFSVTQLTNKETWSNNLLFGNNFGNINNELSLTNNIVVGQNINFNNNEITNNIFFGNNLTNLGGNQYKANNNLFIGGTYYDTTIDSYQNDNIIQDNIFIKNLGFGNTQKYFQFVAPIKLSNNTPLINNPSTLDKNTEYVLIEKSNGVNKILLNEFGLNTILNFNNTTTKSIKLNDLNIDNKDKNIILSENNFILTNFTGITKNIYFGTTDRIDDIDLNNVINIGNKSLMNANDSINVGNNNFKYLVHSLIVGNNNNTNIVEETHNFVENYVFGDNNFKNYNGYVANNLVFGNNNHTNTTLSQSNITIGNNSNKDSIINSSIIVGNNSNNNNVGDYNIIVGNNNNNDVSVERSGNILIGNYVENKLIANEKNQLLIHNYTNYDNITQDPLIIGSFNAINPYFKINGKFQINPTHLLNANNDITHTKLLSINSLGEIATIDKNKILNNNVFLSEIDTGGFDDNGNIIYRSLFTGLTNINIDISYFNIINIIRKSVEITINGNSHNPHELCKYNTFVDEQQIFSENTECSFIVGKNSFIKPVYVKTIKNLQNDMLVNEDPIEVQFNMILEYTRNEINFD